MTNKLDDKKFKEGLRLGCTLNHLIFTRYFFKKREGTKFIVNPHHKIIGDTLDRVFSGEIKRLIINVPPGYTKTEMAVISFIARGLAVNPQSKFIHTSYSDSLALNNSILIRDIITSEEFTGIFPMELRKDSHAKKYWYNTAGGGMYAVSSGGAITGFRAGRMVDGFSGAFIVDDPIKPEDAYSQVKRDRINNRINSTFKSRLAHEDIPIVFIMQRIHEDDTTGFLLRGGTGEKWHHLNLPVRIEEEEKDYPKDYTHGIPIDYKLPTGPLWEYKHNNNQIDTMMESDPYTTAAQYFQRPSPAGGGLVKESWWKYYNMLPDMEWTGIFGDTAQKTKEHNDFSVFQLWGKSGNNIYLIDQIRGKWESTDLRIQFIAFWNKHHKPSVTLGKLRCAYIEDKSSGTGLIQDIKRNEGIPIKPIQRNTDKVTRLMDKIPYISSGYVYLPEDSDFLSEYIHEFSAFTPLMSHKHDDQIDPTLDAIDIMLSPPKNEVGGW